MTAIVADGSSRYTPTTAMSPARARMATPARSVFLGRPAPAPPVATGGRGGLPPAPAPTGAARSSGAAAAPTWARTVAPVRVGSPSGLAIPGGRPAGGVGSDVAPVGPTLPERLPALPAASPAAAPAAPAPATRPTEPVARIPDSPLDRAASNSATDAKTASPADAASARVAGSAAMIDSRFSWPRASRESNRKLIREVATRDPKGSTRATWSASSDRIRDAAEVSSSSTSR